MIIGAVTAFGQSQVGDKKVFQALGDFKIMPAGNGFVTYYEHAAEKAVAINAAQEPNRNKWAAAELKFPGADGTYKLNLKGLREWDGDTEYKIKVNGTQVGTDFKNDHLPENMKDYTPQFHTVENVVLKKDDVIRVESKCVSNGLIPEKGAFAWARGRWTQLEVEFTGATTGIAGTGIPVISSRIAVHSEGASFRFDFVGMDVKSDANARFTIYSVSGKAIKVFQLKETTLLWDGRLDSGIKLESGKYTGVWESGSHRISDSFMVF